MMPWNPGQLCRTPENPRMAAAIIVAPIPLFTPLSRIFLTDFSCFQQNTTIAREPINRLNTTIALVSIFVRLDNASTSPTDNTSGIRAIPNPGRSSLVGTIFTGFDSSIAVPSLLLLFWLHIPCKNILCRLIR